MVLSGLSTILAFSLSVWGLRNAASSAYRLVSTGKSAFFVRVQQVHDCTRDRGTGS